MKTIIYLIRHTQTVGNIEQRLTGRVDYKLTPQGRVYIKRLTEKLKDVKFDIAYSSSTKRTYKTLERLARLNNIHIHQRKDLCEMDFGEYDGMKWEEINKINPKIKELQNKTNEIMSIPGQETTEELTNRMMKTMLEIANENIGKTILICSHGVAIEAFLREVTGDRKFKYKKDQYSQRTTSINILSFNKKTQKFKVEKLNDYEHIMI